MSRTQPGRSSTDRGRRLLADRPSRVERALSAGLLPLLLASGSAAQTFTGLAPAGDAFAQPLGVSADGSAIAGSIQSTVTRGFRWTKGGSFQVLGPLPGGMYAVAFGISADGSIVAGQSASETATRAFRWTSAGGIQDLGVLPGDRDSLARAVSASGSAIVGWSARGGMSRAVRWDIAGIQEVPMPPGITGSFATGVSGDGSVVVGGHSSPAGLRAFRWTEPQGAADLGVLPGDTGSEAAAVSANGLVVIGRSAGLSDRPFRWTAQDGMRGLAMPPGCHAATAYGVSADGSIIVGSGLLPSSQTRAALWSAEAGAVDLNAYLVLRGMDLSGWVLTDAYAVSLNGRAMCGVGLHEGKAEGWLAVLPDPPCQANCNADRDPMTGTHRLDIGDFVCFQNAFALGDYKADVGGGPPEPGQICNSDGYFTIEDFVCFQNLFALGCK